MIVLRHDFKNKTDCSIRSLKIQQELAHFHLAKGGKWSLAFRLAVVSVFDTTIYAI